MFYLEKVANQEDRVITKKCEYEALRYIREKPGRVYYDELERIIKAYSMADSDSTNNQNLSLDLDTFLSVNSGFLEDNKDGKFVYSIPGNRKALDAALQNYSELCTTVNKWNWNEYLYYRRDDGLELLPFDERINDSNGRLDIKVDSKPGFGYRVTIVAEVENNKWLYLGKYNLLEKVINKLDTEFGEFSSNYDPVYIEKIILNRVVFDEFSLLPLNSSNHKILIGNMSMQYCIFKGNLIIDGIEFDFWDTDYKEISFRNTRFFENVEIRNVFVDGHSDGMITFEDARIDKNVIITHSVLNKTKLSLFQTVFGDYVSGDRSFSVKEDPVEAFLNQIELSDVLMDPDSSLELKELEMSNGIIEISGMKAIPRTDIFFHYVKVGNDKTCPNTELIIRNSNLEKDMSIGNVQSFDLSNVILSARILENDDGQKPHILYRSKTKGFFGTQLTSKLLTASYNSLRKIAKRNSDSFDKNKVESNKGLPAVKALEFVALKENFAKTGKYDYEDEALLLYMELKPYLDKSNCGKPGKKSLRNQLFYKALYATGKYGISPLRTILSLIIVGIIFGLAFWGIMAFGGPSIISYGGTIENSGAFLKAFVFSINQLVPFISNPEFSNPGIMAMTIVERFVGLFLIGYFSVSVVRKTRR